VLQALKNKSVKRVWLSVTLLILGYIFYAFNPYASNLFPKCPFYVTTGYKCPGCGSQRAMHSLLNFDIIQALKENPLLVAAIPYVFLGLLLEYSNFEFKNRETWRNKLFGIKAIWIVFTTILLFWFIRNIYN